MPSFELVVSAVPSCSTASMTSQLLTSIHQPKGSTTHPKTFQWIAFPSL